jgi:hypothetical protein
LQVTALSDPGDISEDDEEPDGADGDNGAGHPDAHRYPKEGEAHAGGLMLFVKRLSSSESSGSATNLVSVAPHFAHSNIRFSELPAPGSILANRIRVKHLTQRGHSIGRRAASIWLPHCEGYAVAGLSSVRSQTHGSPEICLKSGISEGEMRPTSPLLPP